MEEKSLTHGIKLKDRVGYALGDTAGITITTANKYTGGKCKYDSNVSVK